MNINRFRSVLFLSFLLAIISTTGYAADLILNNVPAKVFFSPNGGCTQSIVDEIKDAKTEILVQAYSFTSPPIAKALLCGSQEGLRQRMLRMWSS